MSRSLSCSKGARLLHPPATACFSQAIARSASALAILAPDHDLLWARITAAARKQAASYRPAAAVRFSISHISAVAWPAGVVLVCNPESAL